jgi:hypothetical protein
MNPMMRLIRQLSLLDEWKCLFGTDCFAPGSDTVSGLHNLHARLRKFKESEIKAVTEDGKSPLVRIRSKEFYDIYG